MITVNSAVLIIPNMPASDTGPCIPNNNEPIDRYTRTKLRIPMKINDIMEKKINNTME